MAEGELCVLGVRGIGEVRAGADLAELISLASTAPGAPGLHDGDVVVVTSKVVAKAEGRVVALDGSVREEVVRPYDEDLFR